MKMLEITNLQVYPVKEPNGKLRAFARVVLADQIQLNGLRVYDGVRGLFVSYPTDTSRKGEEYHQIYHPVTSELRSAIEKAVLAEYNECMKEA